MPDYTPIYHFTYPCPDELVTSGSFTALANEIDAKLADVNNDLLAALLRHNVTPTTTGNQVIPAGVDTVLTIPGMTYVIPQAGIWVIRAQVNPETFPVVNMMRARLLQNAVVRGGFTHNTEGSITNAPIPFVPIVAAVGDTITTTFLYDGLLTMTVNATFNAKLIVRIA